MLIDPAVPTFVFFEWSKIARTWASLRQRPHHMARVLAGKGFQVLFVEPPSAEGTETLRPKPLTNGIFFVTPRAGSLSVMEPWLQQLSDMLPDAPWIIHHPAWAPFLRDYLLTSRLVVYDCMDEWAEMPGSSSPVSTLKAKLAAWEIELAVKSHFVSATSISLWARMKLLNHTAAYIPNAAYTEDFHFRPPQARDLQGIPRPRLLFVGLVGEWVDLELVRHVAAARPDWSLVMVGPTSVPSSCLPRERNIFWLGEKPYEELGSYLHYCEVGIVPFKQNKLTQAVNPIKAHEYLAAGLPVVSTFLPDLLLVPDPAVQVTNSYDTFVKAVERTLRQHRKPQKSAVNRAGSWEERVEELLACLEGRGLERHETLAERYANALAAVLEEDYSPQVAEQLALVEYVRGHYERVLTLTSPGSPLRQAALVRMGRGDELFSEWELFVAAQEGVAAGFRKDWPPEAIVAQVLLNNGEPAAALETLNKTKSFVPAHHLVFGRSYARLGFFGEAVTAFSLAAESDPSLLEAADFLTLGDVLRKLGFETEAEEHYLHACALGRREEGVEKLSQLYFDRALSTTPPRPGQQPAE